MINQTKLDDLASKLSKLPCPECGETHSVRLKSAHSSSMDRPVVSIGFPDQDTCNGFKQKATAFANRFMQSMNLGPFPFDRI